MSGRHNVPGVIREGQQDQNGQRVCGYGREGSDTEKVDKPVESDC